MKVAEKIARLCDERGVTQARVEEVAQLSAGRISKWLGGTGEPTARQALRVARFFGVPLEWLADDATGFPVPAREGLDDDTRMVLRQFDYYRSTRGLSAEEAIARLSVESPAPEAPAGPPTPKARQGAAILDDYSSRRVAEQIEADQKGPRPKR